MKNNGCERNDEGDICGKTPCHDVHRGPHGGGPECFRMCRKHAAECLREGCEVEGFDDSGVCLTCGGGGCPNCNETGSLHD
jgi:hypothetical protein